jgi:hypothetical protein
MPTRPSKREDALQAAARIVQQTTGQSLPKLTEKPEITNEEKALRSQAASILGKLGGSKGGNARAKNLTAERRQEIAKKAASARWSDRKDV